MEAAESIHKQILQFKEFWNGLVNEKNRAMRQLSAATISHNKESGITHGSVAMITDRIEKGQQAMAAKGAELEALGYSLIGNGEAFEPYDENLTHTVHAIYGFKTQHESVYDFAARNNALYGKKK